MKIEKMGKSPLGNDVKKRYTKFGRNPSTRKYSKMGAKKRKNKKKNEKKEKKGLLDSILAFF